MKNCNEKSIARHLRTGFGRSGYFCAPQTPKSASLFETVKRNPSHASFSWLSRFYALPCRMIINLCSGELSSICSPVCIGCRVKNNIVSTGKWLPFLGRWNDQQLGSHWLISWRSARISLRTQWAQRFRNHPTHLPTHQSANQSISQPNNQSTHQSVNPSISQPNNQPTPSISQSTITCKTHTQTRALNLFCFL